MTKILMCLFGNAKNDGRVLRSIQALNFCDAEVSLISFDTEFSNENIRKHFSYSPNHNRYINLLKYSIFVLRCLKKVRPSVVYLHDYYLSNVVFWVKLFYPKIKVIYDAHELIIPNNGVFNGKRQKFFYKIEKSSIKKMDLVITANSERGNLMKEHYKLEKEPLIIKNVPSINRLADSRDELPNEAHSFISNAKAKGGKLFVYQGAMVRGRNLEKVIKIFSLISDQVSLIMIGDGANLASLKELSKVEGGTGSIFFTGRLDVPRMYRVLKECDFGIIAYSNSNLNNIFCAPNKLYEYANLMLPFIATNQKTIINEVRNYSFVKIIDMEESASKIVEDILAFSSDYNFDEDEFLEFNRLNNWELEQKKIENVLREL